LNIARSAGIVPAAGQPVRNDRVVNRVDLPGAVLLDECSRALSVVDVGRFLRAREQRIGRPALPETAKGRLLGGRIAEALARSLPGALGLCLGLERAEAAENARDAEVLTAYRVVDLRTPPT
jgi:hypothetical protein